MGTKITFDLENDWNYLPSSQEARDKEKKGSKNPLPKFELEGLKYDDLRGLSWTILEEYD